MRIAAVSSSGFHIGSPSGDASKSRVAELMKRKQEIGDLKRSYRDNALKQGKSAKEIDDKMKEYDSQISEIDAEIAKLAADKQKKALQSNHKSSNNQNRDQNEIGQGASAAQQQFSSGISSIQRGLQLSKSVQHAQQILKTEALSYRPSFAYRGNSQKAAELTGKANSLNEKLNELHRKTRKFAEETTSASILSNQNEPKNSENQDGKTDAVSE